MLRTNGNPVFLIKPVVDFERLGVGNRVLRHFVNDRAGSVDSNERNVVAEVVDYGRVANVLDVEVDADVLSGEEVRKLDFFTVDNDRRLPVIDRFLDDCEVRSDDRLIFKRAHVDRADNAADRETYATVGARKVRRGVAGKIVEAGVNRVRTGHEPIVFVELRIDAQKRTIRGFERVGNVADLRNVRQQRTAKRRRRARDRKEIVARAVSDVVGENRVVDDRDSSVVETSAVVRRIGGDRNVDESRGARGVNRAAQRSGGVLSEERVGGVQSAGGVNRARVDRRFVADEIAIGDRNVAVGVNRAGGAAGRLVVLNVGVRKNHGAFGVNNRAVASRNVPGSAEFTLDLERSDLERAALTRRRDVVGNSRGSGDNDRAAGINRAAFASNVAGNDSGAADGNSVSSDNRAVFVVCDRRVAADQHGAASGHAAENIAGNNRIIADRKRLRDGKRAVFAVCNVVDQFKRSNRRGRSEVSRAIRAGRGVVGKTRRA